MLSSAPSSNNPKKSSGPSSTANDKKSKKSRGAEMDFQSFMLNFFAFEALPTLADSADIPALLPLKCTPADMQDLLHEEELGYDSDRSAYSGIGGADFEDNLPVEDGQEVEAKQRPFPRCLRSRS